MSYDENRISDLIDGGLKEQEESIRVDYALYRKISDTNPLIRFETLKDAKDEYLNSKDYTMIVCEVSELKNGKRIITQERVIKAPQIWLPADRFIPEFNGYYLCYIEKTEECRNVNKGQDQVFFLNNKWATIEREKVTHWMIVEDPPFKRSGGEK